MRRGRGSSERRRRRAGSFCTIVGGRTGVRIARVTRPVAMSLQFACGTGPGGGGVSAGWVHTWQAGNRHKRFTFADAVTSAECSLDRPSFGPRDLTRRTRWTLTSAAHPVSSPELIVRPRTLSTRPCQRASVRRASTRTDGHLMMSCGRERRAAANERLHHSGDIHPPLSTQTAASCAQRCPTYHPVHVRFMLCASCADVMDKRYRGGATKLVCWRPLNMMW